MRCAGLKFGRVSLSGDANDVLLAVRAREWMCEGGREGEREGGSIVGRKGCNVLYELYVLYVLYTIVHYCIERCQVGEALPLGIRHLAVQDDVAE